VPDGSAGGHGPSAASKPSWTISPTGIAVQPEHAGQPYAAAHLPPDGQRLIALLTADPHVPYAQISVRLGIPVGSIGPTRRRCLDKLRRHPAIAALIIAGAETTHGEAPCRYLSTL